MCERERRGRVVHEREGGGIVCEGRREKGRVVKEGQYVREGRREGKCEPKRREGGIDSEGEKSWRRQCTPHWGPLCVWRVF